MIAPVVLFVYNRPGHTRKVIESLARNSLAKDTEVFIYADGPKSEGSNENMNLVREYLDSLSSNLFKNLQITKAETNQGLAKSIINGVSEIIRQYGRAIVLEDDIVISSVFLEYMNDALDYYEDNQKIWSISGYSPPIEIPTNYKSDVYLSYRGCSWGWGTWLNRWEKVDWEVKDYPEFKSNVWKQLLFNRGGDDLSMMLHQQMFGESDSWAIRWCFTQSNLEKYTIYPIESKVANIGIDGSGTHSGSPSDIYDVNLGEHSAIFKEIEFNKKIVRSFKRIYTIHWDWQTRLLSFLSYFGFYTLYSNFKRNK